MVSARRRSHAIVLVLFALLAVCLTWPLARHAATSVEDLHDALLNTWILAWDGHQLLNSPLRLFDANIFYPFHNTLAFSEIILPQALAALPLTLATGNPIFGYNMALLLSLALSGFAMYLLVARLTRSRLGGVAAGIVFAFGAYKMSNLAQAQLLAMQWLPLALLYLDRLLGSSGVLSDASLQRARSRCSSDVALLALFLVLQALSSFYYAILTAFAVVLFLLVVFLVHRPRPGRRAVLGVAAALAAAALVILPFLLPYVQVERQLGFKRSIEESVPFSASLVQYAQALPGNVLYGAMAPTSPVVIGGYALDALFPGLAVIVLASLGLVVWRRQTRLWLFPMLLVVTSFLFSLGPVLTMALGQTVDLPVAMPYRLLYFVPGLQALRAPVRFASVVFLGLSVLVGLGVAALEGRGGDRGPRHASSCSGKAMAAVAAVILVAEVVTIPGATAVPVPTGDQVPEVYRWLAQQESAPILELPMMACTPERGLLNQYFSAYHWQPTLDGYSGFIPPAHGQVAYEMESFPTERSLSLLQGLGVRYVIVRTDEYADWSLRRQSLSQYSADLSEVQRFGDTMVYAVTPRDAEAGSLTPSIYLPDAASPGAPYTISLIVAASGDRSSVTDPTLSASADVVWRDVANVVVKETRVAVPLPMVTSEADVTPITVTAPGAGSYNLQVHLRLPDGLDTSQSMTVAVRADAPAPEQIVPARLISGAANQDSIQPGDPLIVRLRWHALGKIDAYYSVFVRLLDKNGQALAQVDGQPGQGMSPTLVWAPGQDVDDVWTLPVPASVPPGRYVLDVGMYAPADLSPRLTLDAAHKPVQRLLLGYVRVAPLLEAVTSTYLPLTARLGDKAALVGYTLEGCRWVDKDCRLSPAQFLGVTLYWKAESMMQLDYSVFVHVADAAGRPIVQHDGPPQEGAYPTTVWQPGDLVADRHKLVVPADASPGVYQLLVGMYDPNSEARLAAGTEDDSISIVRVIIE